MSMRLEVSTLSLLVVFTLGGCSVLPRPAPPPRYHDFGPVTTVAATLSNPIALHGVTAPAWLESNAIWYRFLNRDPTRLRAYAENRWIEPPSQLLARAVQERLRADGRARYRLRLRVVRFEQDFAGPTRATVLLRVRAVLLSRGDLVLAQRFFQLSAPTVPDVSGAVHGLAALGERAAKEISAWAAACTDSAGSVPLPGCGGS